MKYIALSILIGFIAVSIFSFGSMSHEEDHAISNCMASVIDKVACPQSALVVALHHISAYQTFFQTLPPSSLILFSLMFILLAIGYIFFKNFFSKSPPSQFLQYIRNKRNNPEPSLHQLRKITHWLSLFENSPSLPYATP